MAENKSEHGKNVRTIPELDAASVAALDRAGLGSWALRGHGNFLAFSSGEPTSVAKEDFDISEILID